MEWSSGVDSHDMVTVPKRVARISFCIFIDSSIISTSPSLTSSPTETCNETTFPGIVEDMIPERFFLRPPPADRLDGPESDSPETRIEKLLPPTSTFQTSPSLSRSTSNSSPSTVTLRFLPTGSPRSASTRACAEEITSTYQHTSMVARPGISPVARCRGTQGLTLERLQQHSNHSSGPQLRTPVRFPAHASTS